jgi:hypothetical protein
MKHLLVGMAIIVMIGIPMLCHAQDEDIEYDAEGPPPYNDVEDGQLLKIASYVAMPVGWLLEHGVTRPLHKLATDSAIAPVIAGDTDEKFFGEASNANLLPPDTFRPFQMPANPNQMDMDSGPPAADSTTASSVTPSVSSQRYRSTTAPLTAPIANPLGQAVIH